MKGGLCALATAGVLTFAASAAAFVANPVGGHPGELDVNLQITAERGKTEPGENRASTFKSRDFYEYKLGAGYTFGHYGPLQFLSLRIEATVYQTPEEKNDPNRWVVSAPSTGTEAAPGAAECRGGAAYLGDGVCRFYPADRGTILTGAVSFAAIHTPTAALGVFLRGQVPINMELEKFQNPRIDYFAAGLVAGFEFNPWLGFESHMFLGWGTRPFSRDQNGAVALTNLFHVHHSRWLLPWKAGLKLGFYVEGDIHERFDARYDAAYAPFALAQPDTEARQQPDRIRAARFALALLPYFLLSEHLAVELGYVQKFFGYDARATQAYFAGVRALFDFSRCAGPARQ